jgi:hypothetical protein
MTVDIKAVSCIGAYLYKDRFSGQFRKREAAAEENHDGFFVIVLFFGPDPVSD